MVGTLEIKNVDTNSRRFSLTEILSENPEWLEAITGKIWHNIKSSPTWKQIVDLHARLENVESHLARMDSKLDELLCRGNGGNRHES